MDESILYELLKQINEVKQNLTEFRQESNEKLQKMKEEIKQEIRQELNEKLQEMKQEIRQELNEKLQEMKEEIRQELDEKLQNTKKQIITEISSDVGEQLNNVMIVINRVEKKRHDEISSEIKIHENKAIKGVEALKNVLIS